VWEPGKPSQNENEYFARQDADWLKAQRARLDAERTKKEKAQAVTGMKCPRCGGNLMERVYHSVRIDVCDSCRGVWLDRGEMHMLAHVDDTALLKVIHEIDTQ
jgi:ribosomal protein L37AE/L43A